MGLFRIALLLLGLSLLPAAPAQAVGEPSPPPLRAADMLAGVENPYTVVKGDTLWDISSRFLRDPWRWPDVWEKNPHIDNPHWIYPGDKVWFSIGPDGRPRLSLTPPKGFTDPLKVVKLGPKVKYAPAVRDEGALSDAQRRTIRQYLKRRSLITGQAYRGLGHLVAERNDHYSIGASDDVLVNFTEPVRPGDVLNIYRTGQLLKDPETDEEMGYLVDNLGTLEVKRPSPQGPVARIIDSFVEIHPGDRLTWVSRADANIPLHAHAGHPLQGRVLYIHENLEEAGSGQVVIVGLGRRDAVAPGLVMNIFQRGREINDPVTGDPIRFPRHHVGKAILFFVGDKASYALLTNTILSVHVGDAVTTATE